MPGLRLLLLIVCLICVSLQERRFNADSYANARPLIFSILEFLQCDTSFKNAHEESECVACFEKNPKSFFLPFQRLNATFCHNEASRRDLSIPMKSPISSVKEIYPRLTRSTFGGLFLLTFFRSDATNVLPRLFAKNLSTDPWSTFQPDWSRSLPPFWTTTCTRLCKDKNEGSNLPIVWFKSSLKDLSACRWWELCRQLNQSATVLNESARWTG